MARGSPSINYLFIVDDIIVVCRVKVSNWQAIQEVLEIYDVAAGQRINKYKKMIFFSSNTNRAVREQILTIVSVSLCINQEKYLGLLPMVVGRNQYKTFEIIGDKVWTRINKWKNIFLFQACKEI